MCLKCNIVFISLFGNFGYPHSKTMPSPGDKTRDLIDKSRLAKAVMLSEKKSALEFVWGNDVNGVEQLVRILHVEGAGDIPIPVSVEVMIIEVELELYQSIQPFCFIQL